MGVDIYEIVDTAGTTQSGYWATNTIRINSAILKHLFVDFGNTTTRFETKLVDNKNRTIIYLNSCNTVLNRSYDLPSNGIYTLMVSNATVDTQFKVRLAFQDAY